MLEKQATLNVHWQATYKLYNKNAVNFKVVTSWSYTTFEIDKLVNLWS